MHERTASESSRTMTIDILLSVYNGAPFIAEQLQSVQAQTFADWRLWIRDDGSTDDTVGMIRAFTEADPRIRLLSADGERWDVSRSFGWLLEQPEVDADYVMFCDADDYWLPNKIELTLDAMLRAEAAASAGTPVLVHTDLLVTDAQLRVVNDSLWRYECIRPDRATLRRLLVQNTVTGPTMMMNRPLVERAVPIPAHAFAQDWWVALVARCFGRIVPVWTSTVLYRQHRQNRSGAHHLRSGPAQLLRKIAAARGNTPRLRETLHKTSRQAGAFLRQYESALTPAERRLLRRYAEIPDCGLLRRKLRVMELRTLPEHGLLRNIGLVLRA